MKKTLCLIASLLMSLPLLAQSPQPGGPPPDGSQPKPKWGDHGGPGMMRGERMGTPMGFPFGAWWKNPDVVQRIGLTDDQSQKIEKTFQDARVQLIDLHANLEKQELQLQPLVDADQPDEGKVMAQVDKVAQARVALEKANAVMMLAIRRLLTPDQWKKLQERTPGRKHGFGDGQGGPPRRPQGEGSDD